MVQRAVNHPPTLVYDPNWMESVPLVPLHTRNQHTYMLGHVQGQRQKNKTYFFFIQTFQKNTSELNLKKHDVFKIIFFPHSFCFLATASVYPTGCCEQKNLKLKNSKAITCNFVNDFRCGFKAESIDDDVLSKL